MASEPRIMKELTEVSLPTYDVDVNPYVVRYASFVKHVLRTVFY